MFSLCDRVVCSGLQTHQEVPGLVGAGEQTRRMSLHVVLQPGGVTVLLLPPQHIPECICNHTHTRQHKDCGQVKQLTDKQEVSLSPSPSSCPSPREVGVTCRSSARCSAPRASAELLLLPLHIQHPEEESRRKTSLEFRLGEDGST